MFFILTQLKLIFPRKVLHLAFLYLPKTFLATRDFTVTYRLKETLPFFVVVFHTYIVVFVESENRRCRWVGLIAGQKISSVLMCKRNLQVAHNSCRFHLTCFVYDLRGLVESLVSGCPSDSKKQTSKPNKLKTKTKKTALRVLFTSFCCYLIVLVCRLN